VPTGSVAKSTPLSARYTGVEPTPVLGSGQTIEVLVADVAVVSVEPKRHFAPPPRSGKEVPEKVVDEPVEPLGPTAGEIAVTTGGGWYV
jgi:hypothetical protein